MATAQYAPRAINDQIKLEYGAPQVFALKFVTGKEVQSRFPGGRDMFTTIDQGPLFLDGEDAADFEIALRKLAVQPRELIRVLKVKHAHGGGHSIRVSLASDDSEPGQLVARTPRSAERSVEQPTRTEALLERSVEMARAARVPVREDAAPVVVTPASVKICAGLKTLIDAMNEGKAYAARLGLDLSSEDLRCLTVTAFIQDAKGGR